MKALRIVIPLLAVVAVLQAKEDPAEPSVHVTVEGGKLSERINELLKLVDPIVQRLFGAIHESSAANEGTEGKPAERKIRAKRNTFDEVERKINESSIEHDKIEKEYEGKVAERNKDHKRTVDEFSKKVDETAKDLRDWATTLMIVGLVGGVLCVLIIAVAVVAIVVILVKRKKNKSIPPPIIYAIQPSSRTTSNARTTQSIADEAS